LGPRKARLASEVDYCVGEPKPYIARVERRHSDNQVFLTLILDEQPLEPEECRGMILAVYKNVIFQQDLAQLELYDASTDPPERKWPG